MLISSFHLSGGPKKLKVPEAITIVLYYLANDLANDPLLLLMMLR